MLTRRRGSSPHIKWQDEEETGFVHDKISTENKKIAPQCPPPPASHPYAPKRRETSMLTRRRGSIPDIKWRGWGGGKIYPRQNFHRKNWKSRSAVPLPPPPRHPYVSTRCETSMLTQGAGVLWRGWSNRGKNQPPKKIPRASIKTPKKSLELKLIQKYSHA